MLTVLTVSWTLSLTGCQSSRVVVIPSDRDVRPLPAGVPFTPAVRGWFVPDARMLDILNRLERTK